jgi:hypothetical protein
VAEGISGRRVVAAAVVMIIAAQLLAIATDLLLRQSDPSDVVLLVVLIVLSVLLLRHARWARWATVVLVAAGGLLELVAIVLLIATMTVPGFWSAVDRAIPALTGLHATVVALAAGPAFPLLAGSLLVEALLDLSAAGMLVFAPSVRAYFTPEAARLGA